MEAIDRISSVNSIPKLRDFSLKGSEMSGEAQQISRGQNESKPQAEPSEKPMEISLDDTLEAAEILNETMELYNHKLHFEVHEGTNRLKVAIVDKVTNEVIKEIPAEEVLNMLAKIHDMIGILVDKKI